MENLISKEEKNVILNNIADNTGATEQASIKKAVNDKELILEKGMTFEWNNKMYIVTGYEPVFSWNIIQWTYFIKHAEE